MKVLYFTRDYTPHDYRFLTSLVENGQEVFFLRLERRGRQLEDRSLPPEVKQVPWQGGQRPFQWRDLPGLVRTLRKVVREIKPDVVHAGPVQTCAFIAALAGVHPLVSMSWGSDLLKDAYANRWMGWITRYTLRRTDVLVGDCRAVRDTARAFGFDGDERCVLFPWGVDLARFRPGRADEIRARAGWQEDFCVLSLRSWEPIYGVDVVVKAFARASQAEPRLRLFLLGGGSLAGMVQGLIEQYELRDRVQLVGQVSQNDLPRYYRAADLYVSASHSDGSSISLLEALASGLPALVSAIPGNREWIVPGETGWLFNDGDVDALADGMLRAVEMSAAQDGLAALRKSARELAEQRANWPQNFRKLLEGYKIAVRLQQERGER
jgi:glycosyltransferase involved in cell wall biosynthesis